MGNIIVEKSEDFAVKIVEVFKYLKYNKNEYDMSRQLLRCGTSIGANVAEAHYAQSDADFISKLHISMKECNETMYWIKILYRSHYFTDEEFNILFKDVNELMAILTTIVKKTKERINNNKKK